MHMCTNMQHSVPNSIKLTLIFSCSLSLSLSISCVVVEVWSWGVGPACYSKTHHSHLAGKEQTASVQLHHRFLWSSSTGASLRCWSYDLSEWKSYPCEPQGCSAPTPHLQKRRIQSSSDWIGPQWRCRTHETPPVCPPRWYREPDRPRISEPGRSSCVWWPAEDTASSPLPDGRDAFPVAFFVAWALAALTILTYYYCKHTHTHHTHCHHMLCTHTVIIYYLRARPHYFEAEVITLELQKLVYRVMPLLWKLALWRLSSYNA